MLVLWNHTQRERVFNATSGSLQVLVDCVIPVAAAPLTDMAAVSSPAPADVTSNCTEVNLSAGDLLSQSHTQRNAHSLNSLSHTQPTKHTQMLLVLLLKAFCVSTATVRKSDLCKQTKLVRTFRCTLKT